MSALKDLASNIKPKQQSIFNEHFNIKVVELQQGMHFNVPRATKTLVDDSNTVTTLNSGLEQDIWIAGDAFGGRNSSASCFMTQWKMHESYESFRALGAAAIQLAKDIPLANRTKPDGTDNPIEYYIQETWGLIYNKGHKCLTHTHWPSIWSYTYCVYACPDCAPLIFPNTQPIRSQHGTQEDEYKITPIIGQLILFPAWVNHYVPEHTCHHTRIMIAGNLDVKWEAARYASRGSHIGRRPGQHE
jgi:uncharacterized protein (TIGR02466 family)